MKQAVSFFTFDQNVDLREAMQQSKAAGYDGVEPVLSEAGSLSMQLQEKDLLRIRAMADDLGLSIPSVGAWNLWEYNLASPDPAVSGRAKDIIKKQIECAAIFGADTILCVPGWVGTNFAPGIVRYDAAYENAQKRLAELVPFAAATGVCIAVENVWNKFLLSPLEMKRFLDELDSDYIGAYFDVGNIIYIGYPDQWIEILGKKHLKKLHFCDCRADQAGLGMFVDLFEGDVDFEAVMRAVRSIGYDDWITVEFLPNYKRFPYQSIVNAKLSLNQIMTL